MHGCEISKIKPLRVKPLGVGQTRHISNGIRVTMPNATRRKVKDCESMAQYRWFTLSGYWLAMTTCQHYKQICNFTHSASSM